MGDSSRVTVKIYDQEYTIAGNSSGEQIVVVANHVDTLRHELAAGLPALPVSSLAVLTAVNIADDYFAEKDRAAELESVITDLKKDANHYIQMWEDAKQSFKQYKEDAQNSIEQLQELQRIYNMKNVELSKANSALEEMKGRYESVRSDLLQAKSEYSRAKAEMEQAKSQANQAKAGLKRAEEALSNAREELEEKEMELDITKEDLEKVKASQSAESADADELMKKYKELENSFFDIQMENLQLKNELDKLRKQEI